MFALHGLLFLCLCRESEREHSIQRSSGTYALRLRHSFYLISSTLSLSENRKTITLMKTNEGTGQLEKGFVRSTEFFPTDQEPARTIEPGEQSLHDPAFGLLGRLQVVGKDLWLRLLFKRFLIPCMVVWVQRHCVSLVVRRSIR